MSDASGEPIGVTVAQDFDGDGLAGRSGEPNVSACGGSVALAGSGVWWGTPVPFDPSLPIFVFVRAVDTDCGGPSIIGTSGDIDLYVRIPEPH